MILGVISFHEKKNRNKNVKKIILKALKFSLTRVTIRNADLGAS